MLFCKRDNQNDFEKEMAINSVQKAQRNTFLKFIIYISYM